MISLIGSLFKLLDENKRGVNNKHKNLSLMENNVRNAFSPLKNSKPMEIDDITKGLISECDSEIAILKKQIDDFVNLRESEKEDSWIMLKRGTIIHHNKEIAKIEQEMNEILEQKIKLENLVYEDYAMNFLIMLGGLSLVLRQFDKLYLDHGNPSVVILWLTQMFNLTEDEAENVRKGCNISDRIGIKGIFIRLKVVENVVFLTVKAHGKEYPVRRIPQKYVYLLTKCPKLEKAKAKDICKNLDREKLIAECYLAASELMGDILEEVLKNIEDKGHNKEKSEQNYSNDNFGPR